VGNSRRPDRLDVFWTIDGKPDTQEFGNRPGESRMDEDKLVRSGVLLAAIGEAVLAELGEEVDLFIYVEAGDGWIGTAPFKISGDSMEWFVPTPEINATIRQAREAEDPDKRWAAMEYEVVDGRFTVRLKYPEDLDPKQFTSDRREAILRERFGNKHIHYPKLF
jgi:hypothetical protein